MNRDYLKQVIVDQKEIYFNNLIIRREMELDENINYSFVGIRRTGKSYMLYQQIRNLTESGISRNRILYVNFEDERLLEVRAEDLNVILEIGLELAGDEGKPYVFLDEIQIVDGWEKFVRRLADMKYTVSITGSNSRMLSREIATTLGGRFMIAQVFPYSFAEYLHAAGKEIRNLQMLSTADKAEINKAFDQYLKFGAFPELVNIRNKRDYLSNIYQTIYIGDILSKNNITNDFAVRLILKKIAESVMKPLSFSRLAHILNSAGMGIGKQTVINYIGYMKEAYLLFSLQNYAAKLVEKETSPKYYFMDTGLLGLLVMDAVSAQLENLVAVELIRRYGTENVFYFESNIEVDFYVPDEKLAIQVSHHALDDEDTKERELHAFEKLRNHLQDVRCLLITNSEEAEIVYHNTRVEVVPVWKWLLQTTNPSYTGLM
ncbi:MAG: ATP-binding protein [Lachnospiraceae bacterium]|nr:ATP-binding protein [Lachnospiraceae bacterium]